jgi:SulP family sulfate permease
MVVNGSLSKTAVNGGAGANSQVSGLVVAGLTILTLLFLTGLFESLAGVRATVEDMLVRSGLADAIGRDHLYREVEDAAGDASA